MFPRPTFFEGAKMSFAENLLFPANAPKLDPEGPALLVAAESSRETVSWKELRQRVAKCQHTLRSAGVRQKDRVAGYLGNHAFAIVAMLATTGLGAIWTAISPDSGVSMVVDRLQQIEPKLLFTDDGQVYNSKQFSVLGKVAEILDQLSSVETCLVYEVIGATDGDIAKVKTNKSRAHVQRYRDALPPSSAASSELQLEQLPPDHPVYILYSSGTTGAPKCIVHGGELILSSKLTELTDFPQLSAPCYSTRRSTCCTAPSNPALESSISLQSLG